MPVSAADLRLRTRRIGDLAPVTGGGWWSTLALITLTAAVATAALLSQQISASRAADTIPTEGFYWSVAQYQIAYHRLKQELRAVAAGEPANAEEIGRRAAVMASRASILTEPSEVQALLGTVPGFTEAAQRVAVLQARLGPLLEQPALTQTGAARILGLMKEGGADELISQLATDVRTAEIGVKDDLTRSASRRVAWIWAGFAFCWAALSLWLLYAIQSRRRYKAAARDRQQAVAALEQANLAKSRFLSMVNHEVRSPLQNIVTSAELLAMQDSRPESVAAIRRIRHAVTVLQGQLRDLLTIARGGSGGLPLQVETFQLGELVEDVCAGLVETAQAKGLEFIVCTQPQHVVLTADPVRIAQVLRNLVENAIRYTDAGQVHVDVTFSAHANGATSRRCQVLKPARGKSRSERARTGELRLTVRDTGPGLAAEAVERLQSKTASFAPGSDGSGIGLFVVRDVLQQLSGSVDIQVFDAVNASGTGTVVTANIPVETLGEQGDEEDSRQREALNVLLVDDQRDVRESVSDVTRRLGHFCCAVGSATEALSRLVAERFDVVLIDLEMPGIDGHSLAKAIRQEGGLNADSMLILISAADNEASGHGWPFDGFLQKPIDLQSLGKLIDITAHAAASDLPGAPRTGGSALRV